MVGLCWRPRALVSSQLGKCINRMQNKAEGFMWAPYWQAISFWFTLRSSSSVFFMRTTSALKRSNSCSSTTPVGDRLIRICFRIRHVSNAGGSFFSIPAATWSMKSSRLMPPVPSPTWKVDVGDFKEISSDWQWQIENKTAVMYATFVAIFFLLFPPFLLVKSKFY